MDIPAGTKIDVTDGFSTEDGWETDYSVYERTPRVPPAPPTPASSGRWFQQAFDIADPDPREFTLNVDPESLEVHVVEAVSYQTEKNRVRRQRFQDSDPPF